MFGIKRKCQKPYKALKKPNYAHNVNKVISQL